MQRNPLFVTSKLFNTAGSDFDAKKSARYSLVPIVTEFVVSPVLFEHYVSFIYVFTLHSIR